MLRGLVEVIYGKAFHLEVEIYSTGKSFVARIVCTSVRLIALARKLAQCMVRPVRAPSYYDDRGNMRVGE
jgi:hypothetical protein